MERLEIFNQYRSLLFAIAYRMLGSVTEAEDMGTGNLDSLATD
jgi:RNA polymerase sigma-70 factor, ECF subfamily